MRSAASFETSTSGWSRSSVPAAWARPASLSRWRIDMEPSHPGAVCWAELASVGQPADVEETLARALDIARPPGETTYDALRRFLSPRRLLLVIDNFEHLLEASGVVGELLAACPALTVLVTSREALDLSAEHRVVIEPLALPQSPEQATVAELQTTAATRTLPRGRTPARCRVRAGPGTGPCRGQAVYPP